MKTSTVPVSAPAWHIVDATGKSIGRLSADVAHILRGKNKPTFSPHQLCGDHVIVINCAHLGIPAKKLMQKLYYKHTGYTGHLQTRTLGQLMAKDPTKAIRLAVQGMLPKNRLRALMLKHLHVFAEADHPHEAQQPVPLS